VNIVLMHGLVESVGLLRDRSEYFLGVAARLRQTFGARVLTPSVPLLGTVADRACAAGDQILGAFEAGLFEAALPVHLMAHSMGGFDARFLVSRDVRQLRHRIASVTCIGTPHHGCPILTAMAHAFRAGRVAMALSDCLTPLNPLRASIQVIERMFGQDLGDLDRDCVDVSAVRYFEVAGVGRQSRPMISLPLMPTAMLLTLCGETRHDGLVAVRSACRGRKPLAIWEDDHAGLIGHDLNRPLPHAPSEAHLTRYETLVQAISIGPY
jgi:triacylglycerol lipase